MKKREPISRVERILQEKIQNVKNPTRISIQNTCVQCVRRIWNKCIDISGVPRKLWTLTRVLGCFRCCRFSRSKHFVRNFVCARPQTRFKRSPITEKGSFWLESNREKISCGVQKKNPDARIYLCCCFFFQTRNLVSSVYRHRFVATFRKLKQNNRRLLGLSMWRTTVDR